MKITQGRTLDAGRRVQGFLGTQAAAIGNLVTSALRAKLDTAVSQLAGFQLEQDTATAASIGETATQQALRSNLFDQFVAPIGRIAKIALRDVSDFPALVVLARVVRAKEFVTKVSSMVDAAAKYEQTFVEHGLPTDFVAQIRAALVQVSSSADARARQQSRRSAATAGIKTADKSVRDMIAVLNGVLSPQLKKDPTLSADWVASKRIHQAPVNPMPTGTLVLPDDTTAVPQTATPATADQQSATPTPAQQQAVDAAPAAPPSTAPASAVSQPTPEAPKPEA